MKRLLDWILRPWLLSLVGLGGLSVVIWYVGPFVRIGRFQPLDAAAERLLAILALFTLWGLWQGLKLWRAGRHNKAIFAELSRQAEEQGDPAAEAREAELAQIRERFDQAMELLRGARFKHRWGRQYLYELPWYILIGPPGSGKTTLLRNSGLHFPLADRLGDPQLRGVGGTRNCDWWITDQAVLLDTAGRYTTQDSHLETDRAAWLEFLRLLKRHRRRRPINGALVALSLGDLLTMTEAERQAHARAIRQRIQELHDQFGIRFPIYFLVTKCDLLAGFTDYFADLDRDGRAQVWGMTFPLDAPEDEKNPGHRFTAEFDLLCERLDQRLPDRLQGEPDPHRRGRLFAFPAQFAGLKPLLGGLIDEIFGASRFETPPQLRGVYFTSGTQEGSPIDRVMSQVASRFHLERRRLPAFAGQGQSYFITDLLEKLVFVESGLAGTNLRLERRRRWLTRAAAGLILLLGAGLAAHWTYGYYQNRALVQALAEAGEALEKQLASRDQAPADLLEALPILDRLRKLTEATAEDHGWPLGLDQSPKLHGAAQRTYRHALETLFLPRLLLRLEAQLRDHEDPDFLYEALRVYLMFHLPDHFDAESVRQWVTLDWKKALPGNLTLEQRDRLKAHLDAALAWMEAGGRAPLPRNDGLVKRVRQRLAQIPPDQWIFRRIAASRLAAQVPAFDPIKAGGPDTPLIFHRASGKPLQEGVAGFFTVAGYRQFIRHLPQQLATLSKETWVLGRKGRGLSPEALLELELAVRRHYANAYIESWQAFLRDLRLRPFNNLSQAREVLRVASSQDSPLRNLLFAVSEQTQPGARTRATLAAKAEQAGGDLRSRFESFFGADTQGLPRDRRRPIEQVDAKFEPLHRQVGTRDEPAPELARIMKQLDELYLLVDAVRTAGERGRNALEVARQQAQQSDVVQRLQAEADRLPTPLRQWLNTLVESSNQVIGGEVLRKIDQAWRTQILPFCQKAIANRYPLRKRRLEITLEDFDRFFGPGGLMDRFFQEYLAPYVDTDQRPWRLRHEGALSETTLRQFERAADIRDAFFAGAGKPMVGFSLEPLRMDPKVRRLQLDLGGQRLEYRHGPPRSHHFDWPTPDKPWARLLFEDTQRKEHRLSFKGPWAWFRLLDQSNLRRDGAPDRYRLTFAKDGLTAQFRLQADSVLNPFRLSLLRNFQCPAEL